MIDSSEDAPEHEKRLIRGVWQPLTVEPKYRIDPFEPAPERRLVQCFVVKDPVSQAFCLFLQLTPHLFLTNKGKFLLAAREISHVSRTEFSIWDELDELDEDSEHLVGKLLSNLSWTEYVLYDCRHCRSAESSGGCWRPHHGIRPGSARVLEVHYNMTLGKPHRFHSVIRTVGFSSLAEEGSVGPIRAPNMSRNFHRIVAEDSDSDHTEKPKAILKSQASEPPWDKSVSWSLGDKPKVEDAVGPSKSDSAIRYQQSRSELKHRGLSKSDSALQILGSKNGGQKCSKAEAGKCNGDELLILKTKAYLWDETLRRYYAVFDGRGDVQGSSKNFQMVIGNESAKGKVDQTLLQFGELSPELYFMDYAYPLTAFEAFGICLTRLD